MLEDFSFQNIDPFWTLSIIQGYVARRTEKFDGRVLELLLISRRRFAMSGARFIARGIDDNSNVANFCETELIVTYEHNLYSFLQIRGSIPIFWE